MITLKRIFPTVLCSLAMIASAQNAPKTGQYRSKQGRWKTGCGHSGPTKDKCERSRHHEEHSPINPDR